MTRDTIAKVRSKWARLNKYSFQDMLESDVFDLVRMLRETYGFSRSQAERESHEFQLTLKPIQHSVHYRGSLVIGQRKYYHS